MSITVFLVDDHAVMRDGLRLLLEAKSDIEVVGEAGDGIEALHQITRLCPDVVVVDIAIPGLNGIEVVRRVCSDCPETRCLMLSMHSTNEYIYHAFVAGAQGYVLKESAGSEVLDAVYTLYGGQRFLSPEIADIVITSFMDQHPITRKENHLERLSAREQEILQLIAEGLSRTEIGDKLAISPKTVDTYRHRLMEKLGISDLPSLVKFAIQHGLISLD